jgi:hypothetical protein
MRNSFSSHSSPRLIAHRIRRFLFVGAGIVGIVATAAADNRIEIVPYAGFRAGGDFEFEDAQQQANVDSDGSLALALNLDIDSHSQYQLYFSQQATRIEPNPATPGGTDLDITYLHLGGTLTPDTSRALKPYLVGTLGATWFSPDAAGAHDSTQLSIALGGGLRIPVRPRFSLLLEARGFVTFLSGSRAFFCSSDSSGGACQLRGNGTLFFQYELLAGAAFRF